MCTEFARVVYEVVTDCDSDVVGVFLLQVVVYNDLSIGNGLASRDELNSLMVKKEMVLVLAALILLSPCVRPPSSFPNAVV